MDLNEEQFNATKRYIELLTPVWDEYGYMIAEDEAVSIWEQENPGRTFTEAMNGQ